MALTANWCYSLMSARIVRGKAGALVEFVVKIAASLAGGYVQVERMQGDTFLELKLSDNNLILKAN
ncbi:hypothetical protein [Paenibacillus sp. GCM10012303]|uniref:hypothetical protein n=1 Tax=Paenibacillus sp. GCM10012303 TaxID=3317340 RepID=UPI003606C9B2